MSYDSKIRIGSFRSARFALLTMVFVLGIAAIIASGPGSEDPRQRPGSSFNGSARWALQIAQPVITGCATNSQLYQILGSFIWKDGRLPENTGTWSFVSWSPTTRQICQVNVKHDGSTSKSVRDSPNVPPTGSGGIIPSAWVNSTNIFTAIPNQEVTYDYATLLAFNTTNYDEAPNTAVWGINFKNGKNPLVRWDGHYIGTQLN